jgi:hypothetical protein
MISSGGNNKPAAITALTMRRRAAPPDGPISRADYGSAGGLTTIGQAGAAIGMPAQAPTIATTLRAMGYPTGQFGKNHFGDRNEFLPTPTCSDTSHYQ